MMQPFLSPPTLEDWWWVPDSLTLRSMQTVSKPRKWCIDLNCRFSVKMFDGFHMRWVSKYFLRKYGETLKSFPNVHHVLPRRYLDAGMIRDVLANKMGLCVWDISQTRMDINCINVMPHELVMPHEPTLYLARSPPGETGVTGASISSIHSNPQRMQGIKDCQFLPDKMEDDTTWLHLVSRWNHGEVLIVCCSVR